MLGEIFRYFLDDSHNAINLKPPKGKKEAQLDSASLETRQTDTIWSVEMRSYDIVGQHIKLAKESVHSLFSCQNSMFEEFGLVWFVRVG